MDINPWNNFFPVGDSEEKLPLPNVAEADLRKVSRIQRYLWRFYEDTLSKCVWNKTCGVTMTVGKSDVGIANPLTYYHIDKMSPEVSFNLHTSKIFIKWGYNNLKKMEIHCI